MYVYFILKMFKFQEIIFGVAFFESAHTKLSVKSAQNDKKKMEYLILLVFGTLCAGLMMVMYHKNSELFEAIKKNEDKIKIGWQGNEQK